MKRLVRYAVVLSVAVAFPVSAQTPAGITRGGVVTLGSGTAVTAAPYGIPAGSAQLPAGTATSTSGNGSNSGASTAGPGASGGSLGTGSTGSGNRGSAASRAPASAGGSSGTATGASSSGVPAWVLCPPSGALGLQPFLTGTDLSCAP